MIKLRLSSVFIVLCLTFLTSHAQAWRDAQWRHPAVYPDLYEQNFWDPDFIASEKPLRAENLRTLQGRVHALQTLLLENPIGLPEQHWVGEMKLADGTSVIVDFGPSLSEPFRESLEGVIAVHGRIGRINGRRVLFARDVRVNGQVALRVSDRVIRNQRAVPNQM